MKHLPHTEMSKLHATRLRMTTHEIEAALARRLPASVVKVLIALQHLLQGKSVARSASAGGISEYSLKGYIRLLRTVSLNTLIEQLIPKRIRPARTLRAAAVHELADRLLPRAGKPSRRRKRAEQPHAIPFTREEKSRATATLDRLRPRITRACAVRKLVAIEKVLRGMAVVDAAKQARISPTMLGLALQEILRGRPEAAFADAKFSPVGRLGSRR